MNNVAKELQPRSWRSKETHNKYESDRTPGVANDSCPLCTAQTKAVFTHWKIMANKYPYDSVARVHDMILPIRHAGWNDLSDEELAELSELKKGVLNEQYVFAVEAFPKQRSVPGHFHLHLIVPRVIDS